MHACGRQESPGGAGGARPQVDEARSFCSAEQSRPANGKAAARGRTGGSIDRRTQGKRGGAGSPTIGAPPPRHTALERFEDAGDLARRRPSAARAWQPAQHGTGGTWLRGSHCNSNDVARSSRRHARVRWHLASVCPSIAQALVDALAEAQRLPPRLGLCSIRSWLQAFDDERELQRAMIGRMRNRLAVRSSDRSRYRP